MLDLDANWITSLPLVLVSDKEVDAIILCWNPNIVSIVEIARDMVADEELAFVNCEKWLQSYLRIML